MLFGHLSFRLLISFLKRYYFCHCYYAIKAISGDNSENVIPFQSYFKSQIVLLRS